MPPASSPTTPGHASPTSSLIAFDFLSFCASFLLLACLATAHLAPDIQRFRTWYGLLGSWTVYSLTGVLLVGQQTQAGREPPQPLCVLQAALVYAAPVGASAATTCYMMQLYIEMSSVHSNIHKSMKLLLVLTLLPWILYLGVIIETLVFLALDGFSTATLVPSHFYCHLRNPIPGAITATLVVLSLAIALSLEALLCYRNWNTLCHSNRYDSTPRYTSILVRMGLFTAVIMFGIVVGILSLLTKKFSSEWGLLLPVVPISSALAFGTQKDILVAWAFWRKR